MLFLEPAPWQATKRGMPRLSKRSRSVAGKVALVTGAASGMGRATAHLFADEGAKVAVTDVNADGVAKVVEEIKALGGDGVAVPALRFFSGLS